MVRQGVRKGGPQKGTTTGYNTGSSSVNQSTKDQDGGAAPEVKKRGKAAEGLEKAKWPVEKAARGGRA